MAELARGGVLPDRGTSRGDFEQFRPQEGERVFTPDGRVLRFERCNGGMRLVPAGQVDMSKIRKILDSINTTTRSA